MSEEKVTVSVIKADVGSVVGHSRPHPDMLQAARDILKDAQKAGTIEDFYVTRVGDDINLFMSHYKGDTYVGDEYTVKMGATDAKLYVEFMDKDDIRLTELPFRDVSKRDWYYDDVVYVYRKGYMDGMSSTRFGGELLRSVRALRSPSGQCGCSPRR